MNFSFKLPFKGLVRFGYDDCRKPGVFHSQREFKITGKSLSVCINSKELQIYFPFDKKIWFKII